MFVDLLPSAVLIILERLSWFSSPSSYAFTWKKGTSRRLKSANTYQQCSIVIYFISLRPVFRQNHLSVSVSIDSGRQCMGFLVAKALLSLLQSALQATVFAWPTR